MRNEAKFHPFFEINPRFLAVVKIILIVLAILVASAIDSVAQRGDSVKAAVKTKSAEKKPSPAAAPNEVLFGEAMVAVDPKRPAVFRLGLAQNAVSVIEFPVDDGIYYVHEGNPRLVSVFDSPTKSTDRSVTVYPGAGFAAATSSATITLQMRSGLVLIFEFVPVSEISRNAHRCILRYDRAEVVAARRAAGLAVDLGIEKPDSVPTPRPEIAVQNEQIKGLPPRPEPSATANLVLADFLKNPSEEKIIWTKSKNGLSLAVVRVVGIDSETSAVIVAIRNDGPELLRLAPGAPELTVVTTDERGRPVQSERIEPFAAQSTASNGGIASGSTIYISMIYLAPMLGVRQKLVVIVRHREAIDDPVTSELP